jgi:hypothetical protein
VLFVSENNKCHVEQVKVSNGEEQIIKLETELRQQFEANEEFLSRLRQIVQMQRECKVLAMIGACSNGVVVITEAGSEQKVDPAEEQRLQEEEVEQNIADADQRIQDLEMQVSSSSQRKNVYASKCNLMFLNA